MRRQARQNKVKRSPRESFITRATSVKRGDVMSTVSEALRNEETRGGARRTVAGVVNSVETLEGAAFWSAGHSPKRRFQSLIHFCCLMRWGQWNWRPVKRKARRTIRIADSRL